MKSRTITKNKIGLIATLALLIVGAGYGYWRYDHKFLSIKTNVNNQPLPSPTPKAPIPPIQWIKIDGDYATFNTEIFMKRNQSQIIAPIKFEKNIAVAWLGFSAFPSDLPNRWLISHPKLINFSWNQVNEGSIYLYQKIPTYNSVSDFLKSPPPDKKILIDESLVQIPKYKIIKADLLKDTTEVLEYDFLLTTYKQTKQYESVTEYINVVDATHAKIDKNNTITWSIQVNTTEDNPMYLGQIKVDYIQYDRSKQK